MGKRRKLKHVSQSAQIRPLGPSWHLGFSIGRLRLRGLGVQHPHYTPSLGMLCREREEIIPAWLRFMLTFNLKTRCHFFFFFDNGFFDQPNSLDDLAAIAIVVK